MKSQWKEYALGSLALVAFYSCVAFAVYYTGSGWCLWALLATPSLKITPDPIAGSAAPKPKYAKSRAWALGYADATLGDVYRDSVPPGHELRPFEHHYARGWEAGRAQRNTRR